MFLYNGFFLLYSILIRLKIKYYQFFFPLTKGCSYRTWFKKNEQYNDIQSTFKYSPLISVIMPVYNVKEEYLRESIDSVLQQYYPHWELCISDDNSSEPHIKRVLEEYAAFDPRIKVRYREENGHISACSNSALEMAAGEFTAFLDNDDVLAPFALYEVVRLLNTNKELDLIYSDEDKLLNGKRCYPFFKKQFNMDLLKQMNYICHLAVYRTALVKQVGGLRINYEGVQDWDLAIRIINLSKRVAHIPKILYHWRISDTSTSSGEHHKPYVKAARKRMRDDLNILF